MSDSIDDNKLVKKFETFKSGNFPFSLKYNKEKLGKIIFEAKILFETVKDIPILPEAVSRLEEDLIKKSIFGTAAIEGNPLTQETVEQVLLEEVKKKEMNLAEKEILGLKSVYNEIKKIKPQDKTHIITEDQIKLFHELITKDCNYKDNNPGHYRNHRVEVGNEKHGGVYVSPKILQDVKTLMKNLVDWLNGPEVLAEDPAIRAALAHYYLGRIHPFGNGNGRTARAIEAMLLKSAGIKYVPHMLSNFYYKNIDEYFWAFSLSENNKEYDITPFLEFVGKGLIESLNEIRTRIFLMVKVLAIRDYLIYSKKNKVISQRQYNLLVLLQEFNEKITLKDLYDKEKFKVIYGKIGERSARRDLELLKKEKFILQNEKSTYEFNYEMLV